MSLDKLLEISREIGQRIPHWTQGSGANISYKNGNTLLIKASGLRLDQMKSKETVASVDIASTKAVIDKIEGKNPAAEKSYSEALQGERKPSMETGMHLFLPRKWVFHFHSLVALAMAHENRKDALKMEKWLRTNVFHTYEFVEPVRPGLVLSQRIKGSPDKAFYILENHGVLIQGEDLSILEAWEAVEDKFIRDWKYDALRRIRFNRPTPLKLYFPDSAVFLDRLKKVLEKNGDGFLLKKDAWQTDRDASEIWQATEILFAACPDLKELPLTIAGILADLPTEKYRRGETS